MGAKKTKRRSSGFVTPDLVCDYLVCMVTFAFFLGVCRYCVLCVTVLKSKFSLALWDLGRASCHAFRRKVWITTALERQYTVSVRTYIQVQVSRF